MREENRVVLIVVFGLLVALIHWLILFLFNPSLLNDNNVITIPFVISGLCLFLVGAVILHKNDEI